MQSQCLGATTRLELKAPMEAKPDEAWQAKPINQGLSEQVGILC